MIQRIHRYEKMGLLFLVFGHLIAAYCSFGYNHPDEFFQILEFADHWTGLLRDPTILPWELGAQIRPWFQPLIHALPMKLLSQADLYQPFTLAYVFRLIYSAANIGSLWLLWRKAKEKYSIDPRWFVVVGSLWFFPYLHVRSSSENLSGIFITFAFWAFLCESKSVLTGIFFGFSFISRFQTALGLVGLATRLLIQDKRITREHWKMFLGFLIPVGIGVILDRIGYGNWVFTPYRYFKVNLIDGVSSTYNPYPWYQYLIWITQLNPFVSIPLITGLVFYAKKQKLDPLISFILSYALIHFFISNKEYRFYFPLMNGVGILAVAGLNEARDRWFKPIPILLYSLTSVIAFGVSTLHGASLKPLWPVHMADRYGSHGETWLSNEDYLHEFEAGYYRLENHHVEVFRSAPELEKMLESRQLDSSQLNSKRPVKVLIDLPFQDPFTESVIALMNQKHCSIKTAAIPVGIFQWTKRVPAINRLRYQVIYECP